MDFQLDRRQVVKLAALAATVSRATIVRGQEALDATVQAGPSFRLARPDDLLDLHISTVNLELHGGGIFGGRPVLRRKTPGAAYFIVRFPPQHIVEKSIPEESTDTATLPSPAQMEARISHESQLVFKLAEDQEIPFDYPGLLGWQHLEPQLPDVQQPGRPSARQTYLELPYQLFMTPADAGSHWLHNDKPVRSPWSKGEPAVARQELWNSILSTNATSVSNEVPIRPFWTPSAPADPRRGEAMDDVDNPGKGFLSSLGPGDRNDIVNTFSGKSGQYSAGPDHVPLASQVMLTSLGASLRLDAEWDPPRGASMRAWKHYASYGRDHFAEIQHVGFLYPFGIRAVLIKTAERKIQAQTDSGTLRAYLRSRYVIKVLPPYEVAYADLEMPFQPLTAITRESPPLDWDATQHVAGRLSNNGQPGRVFRPRDVPRHDNMIWPTVGGILFPFEFAGTDHQGRAASFASPVIFVPDDAAGTTTQPGTMEEVDKSLKADVKTLVDDAWKTHPQRKRAMFEGQRVAMARQKVGGDTDVELDSVEFRRSDEVLTKDGKIIVPLLARIHQYAASTPALRGIAGSAARMECTYRLAAPALAAAGDEVLGPKIDPDKNGSGAFARAVTPQPLDLGSSGRTTGAVAAPGVSGSGLTRSQGIAGGDFGKLHDGSQSVSDFFQGGNATLLGGISLEGLASKAVKSATDAPSINSFVETDHAQNDPPPGYDRADWQGEALRTDVATRSGMPPLESMWTQYPAARITVEYAWKTTNFDPPESLPIRIQKTKTTLNLLGKFVTDLLEHSSRFEASGSLNNFTICLPTAGSPWVEVDINEVTFSAATNTPMQFHASVTGVRFMGPLSFVDAFQTFLGDLAKKGYRIEIRDNAVAITHGFGLAPFSLAGFSIQNLKFRYGVEIPLENKPVALDFRFCERNDPFVATSGAYSGGGWFGILLDASGPRAVEFGLEFGATISVALGIVNGIAQVMAGLYYSSHDKVCLLEGYVRTSGNFPFAGIGQLSLLVLIGMSYDIKSGKAVGSVLVVIKIKYGFVKFERSFEAHREIAKGGSRPLAVSGTASQTELPKFSSLWSASGWNEYRLAFAEGA